MDYKFFEKFCNNCRSGYLKPWKSWSIWNTLENEIPAIKTDKERLLKYLTNCLEMEGYNKSDINIIAEYVLVDGKI